MRVESAVTSITWIPSEAISGMPKLPFEMGMAHYDEPPPDRIDDLDPLHENDLFREANELKAWIEVEDDKVVDHGYSGKGRIGITRIKLGPPRGCLRRGAVPAAPGRARGRRRLGQVRPVGRRPHGPARAAPGERQAVLPGQVGLRVDDAPADRLRRRLVEPLAARREPVSAPLDLRQGRRARREVRHDRLRQVVPRVARHEHPVGRGGLADPGDRRRVGARARPLRLDHA